MFREMRRIMQQISQEECVEILHRATSGVLGLHGDNGYPYTVPVSYVYQEGGTGLGIIGFHCAKTGHKIDAIRRDSKVSFTVIDRDEVMPRERTTKYCSVIVFGRIEIVTDPDKICEIARLLSYKFTDDEEYIEKEVGRTDLKTLIFALVPEHMTGKLVNES